MAFNASSPCFPVLTSDNAGIGFPLRHPHQHQHPHGTPQKMIFRRELSPLSSHIATSGSITGSLVAGSNGRKRRATSEDDEEMHDRSDRSPSPGLSSSINGHNTRDSSIASRPVATTKRFRTVAGPVQLPLPKLLESLDKQQLTTLLTTLVDKHPHLRPEVVAQLPRPTIQNVTSALNALSRRLHAAFPYSRTGPGRDDYTFYRVRPVLDELRTSLLQYGDHFVQASEHSVTSFAYLALAASIIEQMPHWDNPEHERAYRGDLYRRLAERWQLAVDVAAKCATEGKIYGEQTVSEWYRCLERHCAQSDGTLDNVLDSFRKGLGWMIGIHPAVPTVNPTPSGHGLFSSSIY
ncbi:Cut8 six-helix bundle-domain-containing protein [Syncephalis fuscata]|nr:Cut8 six-helix bundle-domain-containing protein [Syncephalis fuscata]